MVQAGGAWAVSVCTGGRLLALRYLRFDSEGKRNVPPSFWGQKITPSSLCFSRLQILPN